MMKFCDCRYNDALYDDVPYGTAAGHRGGRRGFPGPFGMFRLCVSATLGTLTVVE